MITVRFSSGFSIQYNDLDTVDTRQNFHYLGKKSAPGSYFAIAPLDCVIEHIRPCRAYSAVSESTAETLKSAVAQLAKDIRSLKRKMEK